MTDVFPAVCPFCGEDVEVVVEPGERGPFVEDCSVCCNPWTARVFGSGEDRSVVLSRADGSE